jgi:hypothetical protein
LEITEVIIVVLHRTVVVETPKSIYISSDVLRELVCEDVFHFSFYVFERRETVATTFPREVLYDCKLAVELNSRTIVLLHPSVFKLIDFVDVGIMRIDETHFVG